MCAFSNHSLKNNLKDILIDDICIQFVEALTDCCKTTGEGETLRDPWVAQDHSLFEH